MTRFYEPTALIVGSNLNVYYTVRDNNDYKLNKLYVTSINWKYLMENLKKDDNCSEI